MNCLAKLVEQTHAVPASLPPLSVPFAELSKIPNLLREAIEIAAPIKIVTVSGARNLVSGGKVCELAWRPSAIAGQPGNKPPLARHLGEPPEKASTPRHLLK